MKTAFTVCSANYLPYAKSLGDSLLQHNPGYQFVIALADTFTAYDASAFSPHTILPVSRMQLPLLEEMNSKYSIFELSCALKPLVAHYLLTTQPNCEALFYFDSDILLYGKLTRAEAILQKHFLVLTPHIAAPLPYGTVVERELDVLRTGLYNAGFFGLTNSRESLAFLTWWQERLRQHCFNDAAHGLFVDQLWLNFAPLYYPATSILFDPGYNMAYWNFAERKLTSKNGTYVVNEEYPLIFFHFSGYDINQPDAISKHQRHYTFADVPEVKPLFHHYAEAARKNKAVEFSNIAPGLGKKPTPPQRKSFWKRKWAQLSGSKKKD